VDLRLKSRDKQTICFILILSISESGEEDWGVAQAVKRLLYEYLPALQA
jgi:hypothetical protein